MPIPVVCPKCRKSFRVSEKFAGKSGPCPNCKATIQVPAATAEVKVHTPEQFASGGKTVTGQLATKPIARKQVKIQPVKVAVIGAVALGIVVLTWVGRLCHLFETVTVTGETTEIRWTGYVGVTVGLLLVSPVLVMAAYSFLRDDELEPYRGRVLYLRAGLCALGYTVLWAAFSYTASRMVSAPEDIWNWLFIAPPFLIVGALIAFGSLDLDFGDGFFHYFFYVVVTMLLQWIAGMGWVWEVSKG